MPRRLPVHKLRTPVTALSLGKAKVYHLPSWHKLTHPQRLAVLRRIAFARGYDPRIAKLALSIIKKAKARPRDHKAQAAALLKWVQDPKNVYYINEPGERLQDPLYTIKEGMGDCDDQQLLLCSLFTSVRLDWRLCLSGTKKIGVDAKGKPILKKMRHIEGQKLPEGVKWNHVYSMVGTPPFRPNEWWFCETTVEGVPLGWDVLEGSREYLPARLRNTYKGPSRIRRPGKPHARFRPAKLPASKHRSPAYQEAMGDAYGQGFVGGTVAASVATEKKEVPFISRTTGRTILTAVVIGAATTIALDWVRGTGIWSNKGHFMEREHFAVRKVVK